MNAINDMIFSTVSALESGGIILYPTDTIWGIGCDATKGDAVEKIYSIKHRDHSKSMLILCANLAMVERYVGRVEGAAKSLLLETKAISMPEKKADKASETRMPTISGRSISFMG